MNNLNLMYKLCSYKGNEKLLINYRLVKESQEIDGKIVKTLQLKLHRRKNRLKNLFVERAFSEIKQKVIDKPSADIYDKKRNEMLVQKFLSLGEIKIKQKK